MPSFPQCLFPGFVLSGRKAEFFVHVHGMYVSVSTRPTEFLESFLSSPFLWVWGLNSGHKACMESAFTYWAISPVNMGAP